MKKFKFRQIPLPIWKEIVEFCQGLKFPEHAQPGAASYQYLIAKELGYEIDEMDAALASIKFQEFIMNQELLPGIIFVIVMSIVPILLVW